MIPENAEPNVAAERLRCFGLAEEITNESHRIGRCEDSYNEAAVKYRCAVRSTLEHLPCDFIDGVDGTDS